MMKAYKKTSITALLCILLAGCYVPVRFDAEVVVDNRGFYEMYFAGYMADTTLYSGLRDGKIVGLEERNKVASIQADLEREAATKKFKYIKDGFFELNWERKGDLLDVGNVSFIRRNQEIISLKYVPDTGLITMRGRSLSDVNKQRLIDMGLNWEGEIRFITNLRVVGSNATGSRPHKPRPGFTEYFWTLTSVQNPTPKIDVTF